MTTRVTVKFFRITKFSEATPDFSVAIRQLGQVQPVSQREVLTVGGVSVRLEYQTDIGHLVCGEFTRIQTENFPYEVQQNGAAALDVEGPIGSGVAFAFNPNTSILAIQFDSRIVSPYRIGVYLSKYNEEFSYTLTPVIRQDAWAQFGNFPIRKFSIGVALPQNFDFVGDQPDGFGASISRLAAAYEAPMIRIEVGMGQRKGSLSNRIRAAAQELFGIYGDIRSMKAVLGDGEGEVDLLEFELKYSEDLVLPISDPLRSYEIRRDHVVVTMRNFNEQLQQLFGN